MQAQRSMTKIGKHFLFIGLVIFYGLSLSVFAQNNTVKVSASLSERNIYKGESVVLSVKISGRDIKKIQQPQINEINGLRRLSGRTSQSQSIRYVNGVASKEYNYQYQFIAEKEGSFNVPPITISINQKQYNTAPILFSVIAPSQNNPQDANNTRELYTVLEPHISEAVVGEQIIVDLSLYFKNNINILSYQTMQGWKTEGFWREELENKEPIQTTSVMVNGVRYQKAVLMQYALFPTKSGVLTLSPIDLIVQLRSRNNRRDIFSFGFGQEQKTIQSPSVNINVKELPQNSVGFSGAVGHFSIERSISATESMSGETIEVKTMYKGKGNIPLIIAPDYTFPENIEEYTPQQNSKIFRQKEGVSGEKTFTNILIARKGGNYTIAEEKVSFYNPQKKSFEIIHLPALSFSVLQNKENTLENNSSFQIKPIALTHWKRKDLGFLYQKWWAYLFLLLPFILNIATFLYVGYQKERLSDAPHIRAQRAKKEALSILNTIQPSDSTKHTYYIIEKSLHSFIANKLNLANAGLSSEYISSHIEKKSPTHSASFKQLMNKCQNITYAPISSQNEKEDDIKQAIALINELHNLL